MPTSINEHFALLNPEPIPDMEFYLNDKGEIFAHDPADETCWFIITKEDWLELKSFIDKQFNTTDEK